MKWAEAILRGKSLCCGGTLDPLPRPEWQAFDKRDAQKALEEAAAAEAAAQEAAAQEAVADGVDGGDEGDGGDGGDASGGQGAIGPLEPRSG